MFNKIEQIFYKQLKDVVLKKYSLKVQKNIHNSFEKIWNSILIQSKLLGYEIKTINIIDSIVVTFNKNQSDVIQLFLNYNKKKLESIYVCKVSNTIQIKNISEEIPNYKCTNDLIESLKIIAKNL